MICQDFKTHLMDFILGELSGESRAALEQHAAACADCRPQLTRLMRARDVLKKSWPDEEIPSSIVLTPVVAPARGGFRQWLLAAPRWASASLATAMAVVLIFATLSVTRTEFRYDQGRWAMSFGRPYSTTPAGRAAASVPATNVSVENSTVEKRVAEKYAAMSEQDRRQYAAMLERLSQQVQAQREADLQKIGLAFDQVKTVMWKNMQRNNAIVEYAARRIATDVKN